MANQFLNAQVYANVMLLLLKNELVMGKLVDGKFKNEVTDENGLTVSVKRPPQFITQSGATLQAQRISTGSVALTVDQYKNVHISVGDLEYVQSYNALMRSETMKSAASALAHDVDSYLATKILEFPDTAGTVNNTIGSVAQANKMRTLLFKKGVPMSDLNGIVTADDGELIRGGLVTVSNDTNAQKTSSARIPNITEISMYETQQCPTYTNGDHTMSAGPQINGASQNKNYADVRTTMTQNLLLKGLGNNKNIKAGETFVINAVQMWDSRSQPGKAIPTQQRFVVLANTTSDGSGLATVSISPPIIVPSTSDGVDTVMNTAYATVDAAPADSAAVTFDGAASTTYQVRASFHKSAIKMVSAKLITPMTGESSFATDPGTGISIRYWRGSDIGTGAHVHRWDMIYGAVNADRRLGVRGWGS